MRRREAAEAVQLIETLYHTEKRFQSQIQQLAMVLGWKYYHSWSAVHSPAGFPDCVLVKPPRLIFAELKSQRGELSDHQKHWLDALGKVPGVEAYCWKPRDWDEIVKILKGTDF